MSGEPSGLVWRKSSYSGAQGNCVEVANFGDMTLLRHSKDPLGLVLSFTAAEWEAFLKGAEAHEFDSPVFA
jgi:Domain of unknown function (DUF397)